MAVEVRPATTADIDDVVAFWQRATDATRLPSDAAAVEALLRHDPESLIVAVDGAAIVGTIIATWDGWRFHLYRMAVDPSCRRQGVARSLVAAARAHARQRGARRLDALVHDGNEGGRSFWASEGFVRDGDDHRWTSMV
jgi:ribosomal protein S18 acetylase RimI-like enzyme